MANNVTDYTKDDFLQVLPNRIKCQILHVLTMSHNGGIRDITVLRMLLNSEVESLNLTSSNINNKCLEDIQKCKKLRHLALPTLNDTNCTSHTLCELIEHLPRLEDFRIADSRIVNEMVCRQLMKFCPNLSCLVLEKCTKVTDDAMLYIKEMKLNKLNISLTSITDKGVRMLAASRLSEYLEDLNIKFCPVTHASLTILPWNKIKYIGFEIKDNESKITPEPQKGAGVCWFYPKIEVA